MMAQSRVESTWGITNHGRFLKKFVDKKMSIVFNQIYIYIYIYIYISLNNNDKFCLYNLRSFQVFW